MLQTTAVRLARRELMKNLVVEAWLEVGLAIQPIPNAMVAVQMRDAKCTQASKTALDGNMWLPDCYIHT